MLVDTHKQFTERKVCVLIPTYNNAQTLATVIRDVLVYTHNIVVVNDGSTDSTSEILQQFPQLQVVSYPKNSGKGYALRQGFNRAVELGYHYAISIDSDGQHYANDLPLFLEKLATEPEAIIIGVRNLNQENVPGKSSFGNRFSNFWFWVITGLWLKDTQSGYRLYPIKALASQPYYTVKYEFEIEVMVRASWNGIAIREVPIAVFYPKKEERITHFRPFRDFTRITLMNTVFVLIAVLYIKPRDFVRAFKKKTSGSSSTNKSAIHLNQISAKPPQ